MTQSEVFVPGIVAERPKIDPYEKAKQQFLAAMLDALTKEQIGIYIENHELSRGARVGEA